MQSLVNQLIPGLMKAFNIFFIVLFVISAGLQYNDPDPYVWMPIYLYGAFLCYMAIKNRYKPWWYVTGLAVYILYGIFLFADSSGVNSWWSEHEAESLVQTMKAEKPWIEETREFFGLMILVMVLTINMVWLSAKKKYESLKTSKILIRSRS
jgi:hypothetical protein